MEPAYNEAIKTERAIDVDDNPADVAAFIRQNHRIERLEKLAGALVERTLKVCVPPHENRTLSEAQPASSVPLIRDMDRHTERLDAVAETLGDVLDRLVLV